VLLILESPGLSQARPEPGPKLGLGLGLRFFEAQALKSRAQALKAGPSQAQTALVGS
jgi:hypothetical protein